MERRKQTAQLAGLLYFLLAITSAFSLMYVPGQLYVKGDPVATTNHILASEFLFRAGIVSNLTSQMLFVFLVLVLYRLLKPVQEQQAKAMLALVLVQVPIVFVLEVFSFTALMVAKGDVLPSFSASQRQDLVRFFLNMRGYGITIVQFFWGLWLIPFGQLVIKSRFIPAPFGVLLLIGGVAYVLLSLTDLLFPGYVWLIEQPVALCCAVAELSAVGWLLFRGARMVTT
ncbi:DUF4386 domain-containing protein [Fibrella sp. HMF5335]|uniref:DUF4386 domain-containing protein n=1 Tax=Fibrella rubiginis TaxID=2817060 RepID=A0A939GBI9_9BACT|nr:DUF4386 domain-containing protein [Fibrella rubiginis]MBO0935854.1 DUF4386 domain-containing protein [Fibrella rubiginis]